MNLTASSLPNSLATLFVTIFTTTETSFREVIYLANANVITFNPQQRWIDDKCPTFVPNCIAPSSRQEALRARRLQLSLYRQSPPKLHVFNFIDGCTSLLHLLNGIERLVIFSSELAPQEGKYPYLTVRKRESDKRRWIRGECYARWRRFWLWHGNT